MKYGLTIIALGPMPFVEITSDRFQQISVAITSLRIALAIEEKFESLVENYLEYEQTLLSLALTKIISADFGPNTFADDRQLINRRISNLLTAARLYRDQTAHDVADMYRRRQEAGVHIRAAFSLEGDSSFGYRVMEAIRNYVQHRSLPLGTLWYRNEWQEEPGNNGLRTSVEPALDIAGLRSDSRFDRKVLTEIEAKQSSTNLTSMIREYVEGLSRVHNNVRDLTAKDVDEWAATLEEVLETARVEIGSTLGLAAVKQDEEGNGSEEIYVVEHIMRRLREMRGKYKNLGTLSRRYVSSRMRPMPPDAR